MSAQDNHPGRPQIADGKIPLWIIVMWILGITWIVVYIYQGLQQPPQLW